MKEGDHFLRLENLKTMCANILRKISEKRKDTNLDLHSIFLLKYKNFHFRPSSQHPPIPPTPSPLIVPGLLLWCKWLEVFTWASSMKRKMKVLDKARAHYRNHLSWSNRNIILFFSTVVALGGIKHERNSKHKTNST